MTEERKAPSIRFKEFSGDVWKKRKLEEVADRFDNLRIPVSANKRKSGSIPYYGANGIQDYVDGYTHDGEYILIAEDGANDLKDYPIKYVNGKVWVNNHAHVVQGRSKMVDTKFLAFAMKQINIKPYLVGGGRAKLNADIMMKLPLKFPTLPEQRAIGSFFQELDQLITLQQRKLEKSRRIKKSMLQKMFPEKEQTVPAIRFKEFLDDVWKKRKLEEVAEITMGQSPNSENYTDNPSDYILVQGNADMKDGKVFPRVWTTQVTKQGKEGDLILSVRAPVGDIGKTDYNVVLGRGVAAIRGNEFIFQTLSKMKQNGYWNNLSTGSTFESINSNDIKSATIPLPSPPEQKVIGSFFQDLDKFIALQQRRLDKLQNMKKALLEQMMM